jgi:hypothetical protein
VLLKAFSFSAPPMPAILAQPAVPARTVVPSRTGSAFATVGEHPLAATLVLAFAGALLLQLWRPFFFLTCDTLSGTLPVSTEAYRRLWEGRSPFYNPYLFGGFNLLDDLGSFTLWSPRPHPVLLLSAGHRRHAEPDRHRGKLLLERAAAAPDAGPAHCTCPDRGPEPELRVHAV